MEINWLRRTSLGYASSATVQVTHAGGVTPVPVNPSLPNAATWQWQNLGTFTFNNATHNVTVSTAGMDSTAVAVDAVRLTPAAPPPDLPSATLTSPAAGQTFTAPASIALAATATPSSTAGATVQTVNFYREASPGAPILIGAGVLAGGVWSYQWTNVGTGTYAIHAEVTDSAGKQSKSATRAVTVQQPGGTALPAGLYFIEADHLATPRRISNQAQQVVWRNDPAEPFGDTPPQENPSGLGNFEFNLRFPGQYRDRESNLNQNWNREYDAALGRYVQVDPIGLAGGINPYSYVENRPTIMVDPLGLKGWYCQRPLGKPPGTLGPPLFNHQYLCVTRADGSIACGGLTTDGNPLSGQPRLTRPDEDYFHPTSCREVDDDKDRCFEDCILRNFGRPNKPRYGIGPLTDCQEYADDLYVGCRMLCNARKGGR